MKNSTQESRINSKLFVVLFIILALILAYISFRWRSDRLEETEERATQTQEAEPTEASLLDFPVKPTPTARPPTPYPRRVDVMGNMVIGGEPEDIPAILDAEPLLVDAETGSEEWSPDTQVIGLYFSGSATAYPVSFLSRHEVINDRVGPQSVVVTWCPLCASAVVYERRINQRLLTFRASGYLLHSNLVLEDLETRTLWAQLTGTSIRGMAGRHALHPLPFQLTTWAAWQAQFPNTRVISGKLSPYANIFDYSVDPYGSYFGASGAAGIGRGTETDERLPARAIVIGLDFDQQALAIPYNDLYNAGLAEMRVGEQDVVVFMDTETATPTAYEPIVAGRKLTFNVQNGTIIDNETGSGWNAATGEAVSGELSGAKLKPLAFRSGFWFSWADFFPDTSIWSEDA
ncbi:MAG: DUF3179 domain-containing protein [Chloroflexi bacterium]|nr:DUF3179 domain-containing protein [Chloroflexota bacterium]